MELKEPKGLESFWPWFSFSWPFLGMVSINMRYCYDLFFVPPWFLCLYPTKKCNPDTLSHFGWKEYPFYGYVCSGRWNTISEAVLPNHASCIPCHFRKALLTQPYRKGMSTWNSFWNTLHRSCNTKRASGVLGLPKNLPRHIAICYRYVMLHRMISS